MALGDVLEGHNHSGDSGSNSRVSQEGLDDLMALLNDDVDDADASVAVCASSSASVASEANAATVTAGRLLSVPVSESVQSLPTAVVVDAAVAATYDTYEELPLNVVDDTEPEENILLRMRREHSATITRTAAIPFGSLSGSSGSGSRSSQSTASAATTAHSRPMSMLDPTVSSPLVALLRQATAAAMPRGLPPSAWAASPSRAAEIMIELASEPRIRLSLAEGGGEVSYDSAHAHAREFVLRFSAAASDQLRILTEYKIGITCDPKGRWDRYVREIPTWSRMTLLAAFASCLDSAALETQLISEFKGTRGCYNIAPGGEGAHGSPSFVYTVTRGGYGYGRCVLDDMDARSKRCRK